MREFIVNDMDKWMHQNNAHYTGAFFEGNLLDNYVLDCKRGYAAVYERPMNEWSSVPHVKFAPYKDRAAVDALWSEFYGRQDEAERSCA